MAECRKSITRKTMLYKTGVEYSDYTMNHVQGCSHGCTFPCYALLMAKRFGKVSTYEEWCEPVLVQNTLELLDREIPRLRNRIRNVQLCFTTDPFMFGYQDIEDMSLSAIGKLNGSGIPCVVLSKGALPGKLAECAKDNMYGITLVSLDEDFRSVYEPGTAPYDERIACLKDLHDAGCRTWVSMEPFPTPNVCKQSLADVLEAVSFVDRIVFGRMNYNKAVSAYPHYKEWYNERVQEITAFCENRGIDLIIKKGTWSEAPRKAS